MVDVATCAAIKGGRKVSNTIIEYYNMDCYKSQLARVEGINPGQLSVLSVFDEEW